MEYFRIRKEKEVFLYKSSVCIRMSDALSPILDLAFNCQMATEDVVGIHESSSY